MGEGGDFLDPVAAFCVWADDARGFDVIDDPFGDGGGGMDDAGWDGVDFVEGFVMVKMGVDGD